MKVIAIVTLGLFLLSPFAIAGLGNLVLTPGFDVESPSWESGYRWTWDTESRTRAAGEGFGVIRVSSEELRAEGTRTSEVLNTTQESPEGERLLTVLEAFQVDLVRYGNKVIQEGQSSTADTAGTWSMFGDAGFCLTPCGTFLAQYTEDGALHLGHGHDGPEHLRLLDFPLTNGKTWTVLRHETEGIPFEVHAEATAYEYVNLKGFKPMQAVRIEAQVSDATKTALKDLARDAAAHEGYSLSIDFDLRFTYWYAPDIQHLAKSELDGFFAGRISGPGIAGAGRVDFRVHEVLKEAHLVAGPERSLDAAMALADATASGLQPTGLSSESWPFQIGADQYSVDATVGEEVRFGIVQDTTLTDPGPDVFASPPDGSRVIWTHRHATPEGTLTKTSEGAEARFRIDTPGIHAISAVMHDADGRMMGAGHTLIEGYTHETVHAAGPIGLGLVPRGPLSMEGFLAPHASSATVTLETDAWARGILHIGEHATEQTVDDRLIVPITDLRSGTQTIAWEDEIRAAGLKMTLEVRYDRTGPLGSSASTTKDDTAFITSQTGGLMDPFVLFERLLGPATATH